MADVFVSYASEDRARVAPIVETIERHGWSVWWDRAIGGGAAFDRAIEHAIDEAKCIVVVWSARSVESEWVRTEANEGLERGVLVPVAIDDVRPPLAFRRSQTLDFTSENGDVEGLAAAVQGLVPVDPRLRVEFECVGRADELASVEGLLRAVTNGTGGLLLFSGEAGVGKSRMVRETVALARSMEVLCLMGHCSETEGAPPYEPLIEHIEQAVRIVDPVRLRAALGENAPEVAKLMPELRALFTDIAEPIALPPDQDRRYLLHGFAEFVERSSAAQPLMLVFEDLHWADDSTCIMLRHLAGRLRDCGVLLLGSYRDNELTASSPFARTLKDLVRERLAEDLHLDRLDRPAVAELLTDRAGAAPPEELLDLVFAETEGNPFFVEEVYRNLEESGKLFETDGRFRTGIDIGDTEVPRGVRLVLEQRLERVSEVCRRILTAAAVSGRVFGFELLLRVGGDEDAVLDALDEATAASLIEDVSTGREARYQFAHELIRQTLLGALALPRRQRLHLKIAQVLEETARDERLVSEIAYHYFQAGAAADAAKTLEFLRRAGQRALETLAFEDALRQLDRALEVAQEEAPEAVATIQGSRARALRGAARIDDALAALAEAIDRALSEERMSFRRQRAQLLVDLYRGRDALADIEALLAAATADGDRLAELEAQRLLTEAYYRISLDEPGTATLAREASDRAIELAREVGDQRALAYALLTSTHFVDYWEEFRPQASKNLAEARSIGQTLDDEEILIDAATMSLRVDIFSPVAWELAAEEIREQLEARRDLIRLKEHLFWMMGPTRTAGHFERSVEVCDGAIAIADRLGLAPVQYPTLKGLALMDLGRFDEAWRSIEQEPADEQYRFGRALARFGFFLYKAHMGAVDELFEEAPPLLEEAHALNRVWMVSWVVELVAMAGARADRLEETRAFLEAAEALTGIRPRRWGAELALAAGELDDAEQLATKQAAYSEKHGRLGDWAEDSEVLLRILARRERWPELVERATPVVEFARTSRFGNLVWRVLALRARGHDALGDAEAAAADRHEGRERLEEVLTTIENPAHREHYRTGPLARELLGA